MTTPARSPARSVSNARRVPRCALSVPVRVTVRGPNGINGIPGRSLDLGEGGIAAMLAGEVHPGDSVGIEFLLPELGLGLHTKAVVRHNADLRCGLEFFGLSLEQQAMIRRWTRRMLEKQAEAKPGAAASETLPQTFHPAPAASKPAPKRHHFRRIVIAAAIVLVVAGVMFWRWQAGWAELQQQASAPAASAAQRVKLPPGVMDSLIVHKVDAAYPEGAKSGGIVLLHIVIAADGTVIDATAANGSEVLNRAAIEAVKEWRYQPYRVNGAATEVETTVTVEMHP